ncbi:EpsG family protein [Nocardioides sp. P5_E3]
MSQVFSFVPASLVIISILMIALAISQDPLIRNRWPARVVAGYWAAMVVYFVGTREVPYDSDMAVYLGQFARAAATPSLMDYLTSVDGDRAFAVFQWGLSRVGADPRIFTLAVALVTVAATWLASRLVLPAPSAAVAFFACTLSPFFVFYATNTVRQGLAVSVLLAGSVALMNDRHSVRRWGLALVALAPLVHLSAAVPAVLAIYLWWRPMRTSRCLMLWAVAGLTYVTGFNAKLLAYFGGDERLSQYADADVLKAYGGGVNRLDFLVLSVILVIGAMILARSALDAEPAEAERMHFLVNLLILWNAYFLCMGFLAYSDRFAAYSWLLFPLCAGRLVLSPSPGKGDLLKLAFVTAPIALTVYLQGVPDVIQQTSVIG